MRVELRTPKGIRRVGDEEPCVIVAEVGLNHEGKMPIGRRIIEAAAEAGCDGVKFQNYRTADFVKSKDEEIVFKRPNGNYRVESRWRLFQQHELSFEELSAYSMQAHDRGLFFHATPTGESGVRDLLEVGASCIKSGSDMLGNLALLDAMARSGLPVVLSTGDPGEEVGMADLLKVGAGVSAIWGRAPLVLLHCVSLYPTALPVLGRLEELARVAKKTPVGYSDHTIGTRVAVSAVLDHGACWLEKHFTLDKNMGGPDHWWSADVVEMKEIVRRIREAGR